MAEIHLFQWSIAFAAALYLTHNWLSTRPASRWRHIIVGLFTTILWIPVAYTANNVAVSSGGVTTTYGSEALAGFSTFMIVVCIAGLLVGLVLWVEEEADEASAALPRDMRPGSQRGD